MNKLLSRINIIDSAPGTGKSTWVRNFMTSQPDQQFLYLTPFISEVELTAAVCPNNKFLIGRKNHKIRDLEKGLAEGQSIVATHNCFENATHEILALASDQQYTLIIDETINPVEFLKEKKSDVNIMCSEKFSIVGDDGLLQWINHNYDGKYNNVRDLALEGKIRLFNDQFARVIPPEFFRYFSNVYVMTYMFKAQPMYYYFCKYGFEMDFWQIKEIHPWYDNTPGEYKLIPHTGKHEVCQTIKDRLVVYEGDLNFIGRGKKLNWTWYKRNQDQQKRLGNNIRSFFRFYCHCPNVDQVLWSCYKGDDDKWKRKVSPKSYVSGFLACTARATNDYSDRLYLAYCINRCIEPNLKRFLIGEGDFDEDSFALQELLQWIFRSNIRVPESNKKIYLYLPSERMRILLDNYLNNSQELMSAV